MENKEKKKWRIDGNVWSSKYSRPNKEKEIKMVRKPTYKLLLLIKKGARIRWRPLMLRKISLELEWVDAPPLEAADRNEWSKLIEEVQVLL